MSPHLQTSLVSGYEVDLGSLYGAEATAILETLIALSPVGFGFVDLSGRLLRLNESLAAINGSSIVAQRGRLLSDLMPLIWPRLALMLHQVAADGDPVRDVSLEGALAADPTVPRQWSTSCLPIRVDDRLIGVGVVMVDTTDRTHAEETSRQLLGIVEGSGDAIFGVSVQGRVTSWNAAAEHLFGYAAPEIVGRPVSVIAPPGDAAEQIDIRARLVSGGGPERFEATRRRKDGTLVEVAILASTATDRTGRVLGLSVIAHDITGRLATERALESTRLHLAEAQRIARLGSFDFDVTTGQMIWSDELYLLLGVDPALAVTPELLVSTIEPTDRATMAQAWTAAVDHGSAFDLLARVQLPEGGPRWVHATGMPVCDSDGRPTRVAGTVRDNTERVELERARRAAERRIEVSFEQGGIGVAVLGLDGIAIRVNAAVCDLLGRTEDLLVGRTWAPYNHPDEPAPGPAVAAQLAKGGDTYADERRYVRPDGTIVWASTHLTLVRDDAGAPQYYLVQLQDISQHKRLERALSHQATHDTLTALPNRALLADRLARGLTDAAHRARVGVIFLDVDHFKVVNDSLGHTAGDELLRLVAARIQSALRPADTVARFGGDEFVVVCDDVDRVTTVRAAERVLDALSQPFVINGHQMDVSASAGIAMADEAATPESLLRDSDTAMYRAKARGRGRIEVFDESLRDRAERRQSLGSALRHALRRNEFTVVYQPIVDLATDTVVSAEALVRWTHPEHGVVSPEEFVPLAEETGLIVEIGEWVLEQACLALVGWQQIRPEMSVAVNLSVRQTLALDVVDQVERVLQRTGVDARSISLELTENLFMEDVDYFAATLARLRRLGVRLAIDDFGTGYSSLSYLQRFPVDAVKVDRAFVDGLGVDAHGSGLVAAIIAMADALHLEVTAEGVETVGQLEILKKLNCARAQGFYFERPTSAREIAELIRPVGSVS